MKKKVNDILVYITPGIVLLLYLIKGFVIYRETTIYNSISVSSKTSYSIYKVLFENNNYIFVKVIIIISLVALVSSIVLLGISFFKKEKKSFLFKTSLIVSAFSQAVLLLNFVTRFITSENGLATTSSYFDFITIPYLISLTYICVVTYFAFKELKD